MKSIKGELHKTKQLEKQVKIFISYSHYDSKIIKPSSTGQQTEFIRRLLALEEEEGAKIFWDKNFLIAGDIFDSKIKAYLRQCDILLAIISQNFLESKYCNEVEVTKILRRKRRGQNVVVVPFFLSACEWRRIDWLKNTHALPSPNRPFSSIKDAEKRKVELLNLKNHLRDRIQLIKGDKDG